MPRLSARAVSVDKFVSGPERNGYPRKGQQIPISWRPQLRIDPEGCQSGQHNKQSEQLMFDIRCTFPALLRKEIEEQQRHSKRGNKDCEVSEINQMRE